MRFVKMHGIGNDYVYLDAVGRPDLERLDLPALARRMSDRHTGVGSDGLILVCRPRHDGHVRMRMLNADGSESEMCGNGVRCVAKFAHDRLGVRARPMLVETGRGTLPIDYESPGGRLASASVDMGRPILALREVPVDPDRVRPGPRPHEHAIELAGRTLHAVFVSMGNPHATIFVPDPGGEDLARLGPALEHHPAFPRRMNIHLAHAGEPGSPVGEGTMRTWERGAGLTQACGTGACAVLVAGVLTGRLRPEARLRLPGGDLHVRWTRPDPSDPGPVIMTGPAADVFEGEWAEEAVEPGSATVIERGAGRRAERVGP